MGPKRKPPPTLRPQTGPRAGQPVVRPRTGQRPSRPRVSSGTRQRTRRTPRANPNYNDWFMLASFQINHGQTPGLLGEYWLHPIAQPYTPYAAVCANCTHRRENLWQFRIYVTTCTVAGARLACIALPDPTYSGSLPMSAVWGAVTNRMGTMVDTTGNQTRNSSFIMRGSTQVLSNANPPPGNNMMGFANGILLVYLLQAPIGLSSDTDLNCTIMARCVLTPINRIPGFLHMQSPIFQPIDNDTSRTPDFMMIFPSNSGFSDEQSTKTQGQAGWVLSHTGDAWLAGGYYLCFREPFKPVPTGSTATGDGCHVFGTPEVGAVYTSDTPTIQWTTNQGFLAYPIYFAIFMSPISRTVAIVGFTNFENAMNQASGNTGMVPSNTELAVRYDTWPTWKDAYPTKIKYTSDPDSSGPLGDGTYRYAKFWKVAETAPPLGRPVYTTSTPITSQMLAGQAAASYQPHQLALQTSTPAQQAADPFLSQSLPHQLGSAEPLQSTHYQTVDSSRPWGYSIMQQHPTWMPLSSNNIKSTLTTSNTTAYNSRRLTGSQSTQMRTPISQLRPSTSYLNILMTSPTISSNLTSHRSNNNSPTSSTTLITSSGATRSPHQSGQLFQPLTQELDNEEEEDCLSGGSLQVSEGEDEDELNCPQCPTAPYNPFHQDMHPATLTDQQLEQQTLHLTQTLSQLQLEMERRDGSLTSRHYYDNSQSLPDLQTTQTLPVWERLRRALQRHTNTH